MLELHVKKKIIPHCLLSQENVPVKIFVGSITVQATVQETSDNRHLKLQCVKSEIKKNKMSPQNSVSIQGETESRL